MERRSARLIVNTAGGTAGKDAKTYKAALPSSWIHALGLSDENRDMELSFDGDSITISVPETYDSFFSRRAEKKHRLLELRFYDGEMLCNRICADYTSLGIFSERYTDNLVKTAFGKESRPSWESFQQFLAERCVPRQRAGLREYLEALGLDEYDPLAIIKKTGGRMAEDQQWLEIRELA